MRKIVFLISVLFTVLSIPCRGIGLDAAPASGDKHYGIDSLYLPQSFVHPGILHTSADMERLRTIVNGKLEPGYSGFLVFASDPRSQSDYVMKGPFELLYRGSVDGVSIQGKYEQDFNAAYQNAVMYAVTGNKAHADKAVEILTAYGNTVKGLCNGDPTLLPSIMGVKFIYAVELMRYIYPEGMTDDRFNTICAMLKAAFIPTLDKFMATPAYSNGNWGASVCMTYIAAAILFNDTAMYRKAVDFYINGNDNGTIANYIDGETGQCQESGRDQAHVQLGLACMSVTCEIAWKQGTDLYALLENRLLRGFEYTARCNLGYDVPYKVYKDVTGKYCNWNGLSSEDNGANRGRFRPVYEIAYNHYTHRAGLAMPYVKEVLDKIRPEGYFYEHFGFGTFLFNEDNRTP